MAIIPGGGDSVTWWQVYYNRSAASVSSRLVASPQTGSVSIEAVTAAEAEDIARTQLGVSNIVVTRVTGPFGTRAAAAADGTKQAAAINQASQAGTIPGISDVASFLKALSSRQTLMRLAEGTLGILLIVVGVAKLADGSALGSVLKKVPIVP
jgi:hypothetical protein